MALYYQDQGDAISQMQLAQDILLVVLQSLDRTYGKQNGPNIISILLPFQ